MDKVQIKTIADEIMGVVLDEVTSWIYGSSFVLSEAIYWLTCM